MFVIVSDIPSRLTMGESGSSSRSTFDRIFQKLPTLRRFSGSSKSVQTTVQSVPDLQTASDGSITKYLEERKKLSRKPTVAESQVTRRDTTHTKPSSSLETAPLNLSPRSRLPSEDLLASGNQRHHSYQRSRERVQRERVSANPMGPKSRKSRGKEPSRTNSSSFRVASLEQSLVPKRAASHPLPGPERVVQLAQSHRKDIDSKSGSEEEGESIEFIPEADTAEDGNREVEQKGQVDSQRLVQAVRYRATTTHRDRKVAPRLER